MKTSSLGLRLILLACLAFLVALAATAFVLNSQFHRLFEERIFAELDRDLIQLTANISLDDSGEIFIEPLMDPRFDLPFSGLYWMAEEADKPAIVSRSLWGISYEFAQNSTAGQRTRMDSTSSQGVDILITGWTILIGEDDTRRALTLSVAANESEVIEATAKFRTSIIQWLALMFLGLIFAAWVQVRLGLAPLETLRRKIEKVRAGEVENLDGEFPLEVQPLATEVNELLALHYQSLTDARERASDLAHGLKTPLTVMLTLARDLREGGEEDKAADIEAQVASMRHYVERELARVRMQTPTGKHSHAAPIVGKMVEAIKRFPSENDIQWHTDVSADVTSPFDAHDLSELLGNLLDNARKWANAEVRITGHVADDGTSFIRVEDDGPGVPDEKLPSILSRGERLDTSVQGTGLGLAICADMVDSYGAKMVLERSELGGLSVKIIWQNI